MFKKLILILCFIFVTCLVSYSLESIDEQVLYLNSQGYSGSLRGMLLSYYNDQNGTVSYALEDAQYKFLVSQGYCCTIPDMLYQNDSYFVSGVTDYLTINSSILTIGDSRLTF